MLSPSIRIIPIPEHESKGLSAHIAIEGYPFEIKSSLKVILFEPTGRFLKAIPSEDIQNQIPIYRRVYGDIAEKRTHQISTHPSNEGTIAIKLAIEDNPVHNIGQKAICIQENLIQLEDDRIFSKTGQCIVRIDTAKLCFEGTLPIFAIGETAMSQAA